MKKLRLTDLCGSLAVAALLLSPVASLHAAPGDEPPPRDSQGQDEPPPADQPAPSGEPVYQPPRRGAPKTRVGGGTRDTVSGVAPTISLLAPPTTGLTSRASPTLYWYLSQSHDGPFEFVVIERDTLQPEPLFRTRVEGRLGAGYHRLDLADHGIELEPGRLYQWSVAIITDSARRSQDIVGLATVERIGEPPQEMGSVHALAGAGLWYDAIEALDPPPAGGRERGQLAALLRQVGLADARVGG